MIRLRSCLPVAWLVVVAEVLGCGAPSVAAPPGVDAGALPDGGPPSDAGAYDAAKAALDASCTPGSLTSFMPAYNLPSGPFKGVCSASQLEDALSLCFGSGAKSGGYCDTWVNASKNADCVACALGPWTGSTWPPILYANNGAELFLNVGGCIALADPSQLTCAEAYEYDTECELAACQATCPVPTSDDSPFKSCVNAADGDAGACSSYAGKKASCAADLESNTNTSPASFCVDNGGLASDTDALLRYLTLACGTGPMEEAGSPPPIEGGSGHDAH
jgi:hypothetical protein